MLTFSMEKFKRSRFFRSFLLLSILFFGIALIWMGMVYTLVYAGENIWTWSGLSGYVDQSVVYSDKITP